MGKERERERKVKKKGEQNKEIKGPINIVPHLTTTTFSLNLLSLTLPRYPTPIDGWRTPTLRKPGRSWMPRTP